MVIFKVNKLLADIISVDPEDISAKMPLTRDNGVEPIDIAALVIACEKEFRITIHDEDVSTFACTADLAEHIDQMLEAGLNEIPERTEEDRTAWFYE